MNYKLKRIYFIIFIFTLISCSSTKNLKTDNLIFIENFNNQKTFSDNWINNSWKSPATYLIEDENLKLSTRPNSKDRVKIRSKKKFTTGSYTWRILIPEFTLYEQVSIGAFLYHNEKKEFEFDFEIGSGKRKLREKLQLNNNEALVYCVSQFEPSNSSQYKVKMSSYASFKMELIDNKGLYFVKWYINNILVKELQTEVSSNIEFKVHCSLENLSFMGDKPSERKNTVWFNSFQYKKIE